MNIANLFTSSVGKKYIMAVTGVALLLFVVGHLVGNLQIFLGPEAINRYGHFLQSNLELIWPVRIGLVALVALHLWSAVTLSIENKRARPIPYGQYEVVASTHASRTMLMSGLIIAAFVIYHLLHFTVQTEALNLTGLDFRTLTDEKDRHDVFRMMVLGFSNGWVSGFYILGMALLCMHLSHGVKSMFQSVGCKSPGWAPLIDRLAVVAAWLIFLGYISIPIAVLLGYGKEALQ
jgi:succinate dehydrogenase / fumarate reductase, cytochrome b subunit